MRLCALLLVQAGDGLGQVYWNEPRPTRATRLLRSRRAAWRIGGGAVAPGPRTLDGAADAISRASSGGCLGIRAEVRQPSIHLERMSETNAVNAIPVRSAPPVMSTTQRRFGSAACTTRFTRFRGRGGEDPGSRSARTWGRSASSAVSCPAGVVPRCIGRRSRTEHRCSDRASAGARPPSRPPAPAEVAVTEHRTSIQFPRRGRHRARPGHAVDVPWRCRGCSARLARGCPACQSLDLLDPRLSRDLVDEGGHHGSRRSCSRAKNDDGASGISLARLSSLTSRASALMRFASLVVVPGDNPATTGTYSARPRSSTVPTRSPRPRASGECRAPQLRRVRPWCRWHHAVLSDQAHCHSRAIDRLRRCRLRRLQPPFRGPIDCRPRSHRGWC